jgi:hypothetical protein
VNNPGVWAAGDKSRWWWPSGGYWPINDTRTTVDSFLLAFATIGYAPADDDSFEAGYEKVALYAKFQFCTFWSATIHRRFGIFRLGANYSLSNVSCGDAEKVLRTGEQSGDKSPQSKKLQNSN